MKLSLYSFSNRILRLGLLTPFRPPPSGGEVPRRRRVGGGFLPETNIQANRMVLKRGFASQEGRKGGELYTPRSVLRFNVGGRRHEIETDV